MIQLIKRIIKKNIKRPIQQDNNYDKGRIEAREYILSAIETNERRGEITEYLKAKQTIAEYERILGDTTGVKTECVTLNLHQVNELLELIEDG